MFIARPTIRELILTGSLIGLFWLQLSTMRTDDAPVADHQGMIPTSHDVVQHGIQAVHRSDDPALQPTSSRIWWTKSLPPETIMLSHTPGYTCFDDLYALSGTFFIVTNNKDFIPPLQRITSPGVELIYDTDPTDKDIRIITPQEALSLFGPSAARLEGISFIQTDPPQFLKHYFHFVVELVYQGLWRIYATLSPNSDPFQLPKPRRFIFPFSDALKWRDHAQVNIFALNAAFPSMAIQYSDTWQYWASLDRPIIFDRVVLGDRAASHKGTMLLKHPNFTDYPALPENWWAPVRQNILEYSAGDRDIEMPARPVITYISRQKTGRKLRAEDHMGLVKSLDDLGRKYDYEIAVVQMEDLPKVDQIYAAARTTLMIGVHGNGLSAAMWMKKTPQSGLIEIVMPPGFAWDYHATADMLGIPHWTMWNDTYLTDPHHPMVYVPDGFHGPNIPVYGPAVAELAHSILSRR